MQLVAINWHVFKLLEGQTFDLEIFGRTLELSADALGLGALGLARFIPISIFALLGGMLADVMDRRRLMIVMQFLAATIAGILAYLTSTGQETITILFLITSALSVTSVLTNPSQQSIIPSLVPPAQMSNAVSLNTLRWNLTSLIGPSIAGILLAYTNIAVVYWANTATFAAMILALILMRFKETRVSKENTFSLAGFVDGIKFTFGTPIISGTMYLDFIATFFSSARTMLPIVAVEMLGVGAVGYGILNTAQSLGGILAGFYMATRRRLTRQGILLLGSVIVYGLATILFGYSNWFWFSYVAFAITGAADMVSTVIRGTLRQMNTPDRLRGRMSGINMIFTMGGPQLGELEAGLVAAALGTPFAIISGGIATVILTLVIAATNRDIRVYDKEPDVILDKG